MAVLAVMTGSPGESGANDVGYVERFGEGNFYVGLNYSPAFSKITGFEIRESTGETAAAAPALKIISAPPPYTIYTAKGHIHA